MAAQAAAAAAGGTGAAAAAPYVAMGVSAGSGIVGAIANRRSQRRAYEYNRALMREQYQLEREQQDYQNAYNSPLEQRKRLEAAGFNPNQGIEGYQSADASAPDPIPMQPMDYTANMAQIASGVDQFYKVQSMQQQLRYQKLKNDEQSIGNAIQRTAFGRAQAEDFALRTRIYESLIKSGLTKQEASKIAFDERIPQNMSEYVPNIYVESDYGSNWSEHATFGRLGNLEYISAQEAANKAPWAAKQAAQDYYRSTISANTDMANSYSIMQRFDMLKKVNADIDKLDVHPYIKSLMKLQAQGMINNGELLGLSSKDIISLLGGGKVKAVKNVTNTFNQKFNSEKTNIISPTN